MALSGDTTIGQASAETGVHPETIRYYERIGLVPRPPRSAGGRRIYDQWHVARLRFVRRSRELGFTLDEVRLLLALTAGNNRSCPEARAIAAEHLARIRTKITDLTRLEETLEAHIARCDRETAPACPIIEALSE